MELNELLLRLVLSFVVLFVMARIMGRKEISQMTFFNFVSAIAIGSIAANTVLNPNTPLSFGIISLVGWSAFTIILGFIDIKSKTLRKITTGDPVIVIKDGQIIKEALRNVQLNLNSLKSLLREKNVFEIADVDYAIFETNGKLSVMKKEIKQPLTKGDLKTFKKQFNIYPFATEVISDGRILTDNLNKHI